MENRRTVVLASHISRQPCQLNVDSECFKHEYIYYLNRGMQLFGLYTISICLIICIRHQ